MIISITKKLTTEQIGQLSDQLYSMYSPEYEGFKQKEDVFKIYLSDNTTQEIQDEITNLINNFELEYPKIYGLARDWAKVKDFRDINYKSVELKQALQPKRYMNQGEIYKVEWYSDADHTDLVLVVDIEYHRDDMSFAWSRTTTRSWVNLSGSIHPYKKVTTKTYDSRETIVEGTTRRRNIYDAMMVPAMTLIAQTETAGDTELARQLGQAFLTEYKEDFDNFIDHSDAEILNSILNDTRTWMDNAIDEHGTTIRQYLYSEFDIWAN